MWDAIYRSAMHTKNHMKFLIFNKLVGSLGSQISQPADTTRCKRFTAMCHKTGSGDTTKLTDGSFLDYSRSSGNIQAEKEANKLMTQKIHNAFRDVFTGILCFEGTLKQRVRES